MASTLPDLLADAGIKLKRLTPGHSEKITCPKCAGGRTREVSLAVTIDEDGLGATWMCHRGGCGWQAGGRVAHENGSHSPPQAYVLTQQEINNARPGSLQGLLAKARAVKAELRFAGQEFCGSLASEWALDVVDDLLRLFGREA